MNEVDKSNTVSLHSLLHKPLLLMQFSEQNEFTAWHGRTGKCERNIRASMFILEVRNPRPRKMQ